MADLTILYLTANRMPEKWVEFHRRHLLAAIGDLPVITVSSKPMDLGLGETNLIQTRPWGGWSTFCEWNRAAKLATTPFVAIAEDDTLYPPLHFREFRPKMDECAYDMSRWTVMTWHQDPTFSMIRRLGGFTSICPRELLITALDEREAKYPNGCDRPGEIGREDAELRMGVTRRKHVEWWCHMPTINLAHPRGHSPTYNGVRHIRRKEGEMKAIEIPYWGKAADIAAVYNEGVAEEAGKWPKVSICIASFNRDPSVLRRTLESIFRQKPAFTYEVILVDDGSEYGAPEVYKEFPVRYHRIERPPYVRNPGVARNVAYRMAQGDIIIAQSDEVMHKHDTTISRLCDVLASNPRSFVIATVLGCDETGKPSKVYTGQSGTDRRHAPLFFLGAVWKRDLYAVGGNDEDFAKAGGTACEDRWFGDCLTNGLHLTPIYTNKAVGYHQWHPRRTNNKKIRISKRVYRQKLDQADQSGEWRSSGGPWIQQ